MENSIESKLSKEDLEIQLERIMSISTTHIDSFMKCIAEESIPMVSAMSIHIKNIVDKYITYVESIAKKVDSTSEEKEQLPVEKIINIQKEGK